MAKTQTNTPKEENVVETSKELAKETKTKIVKEEKLNVNYNLDKDVVLKWNEDGTVDVNGVKLSRNHQHELAERLLRYNGKL